MNAKTLLLTLVALLAAPATQAQLTVTSWNVESGGADPAVISRQLGELPAATIFALQEVHPEDISRYGAAIQKTHGRTYKYVGTWTGGSDRLVVAFDEQKLLLLETRELFYQGETKVNDWNHRSPFICRFREGATGKEFYFVNVHLARGNAGLRTDQAKALVAFAESVPEPVIAIGDFNFDFDFPTQRGNAGYTAMLAGQKFRWAKPATLIDTNWADHNGDGRDDYPDSCLDFVFYAGLPVGWQVTSEVVVRPGDFPDDKTTSDHRSVTATVTMGGVAGAVAPSSLVDQAPAEMSFWLNTSTGVRHNASCKNYKNTKRGRMCTAEEGKPCGICGG